jgi:hypothetical protein
MNTIEYTSGWFDPLIQNKAYVDFATYAPGYGQLQSNATLQNLTQAYYGPNGCKIQEEACYAAGNSTASNKICRNADDYCVRTFVQDCSESEGMILSFSFS